MPGCNFGRPLLNPWLPPAPAPEAKHRQPEPAPEAKHRGRPPVLTPERTADVEEEMRRRAAAGRMSAYVRGEAAYLVTWCKSHGYDISTDTLRHRIADLHRELRQTFDQKSF